MDHVLSYNFDEIEYTVRQEIHTTSARLNSALDELRMQITPLQQVWTRDAAEAYRVEQARWEQAAGAPQRDPVQPGQRRAGRLRRCRRHRSHCRQRVGLLTPYPQDPVRSRLEGSQRDRTVLCLEICIRVADWS